MIFHEADDSHEISYLIFVKITRKDVAKFVVCCSVIGALSVKKAMSSGTLKESFRFGEILRVVGPH